jgi:hypothetical protein
VDTDGSTVSAAPCKGTQDLSQKWNWLANGCVSSVGDPSLCWNADSGSTAPGTPIIMYQCGVRPSPAVAQNDLFYFDPRFGHIVGNESALCFSTETIPPGPPPPCSDDTGCSLNGVCTQSTGVCTCYPPWTGGDCSELDILPAPPVSLSPVSSSPALLLFPVALRSALHCREWHVPLLPPLPSSGPRLRHGPRHLREEEWWTDCCELDMCRLPPPRSTAPRPVQTWGGSVVLLDDGLYHMYVAGESWVSLRTDVRCATVSQSVLGWPCDAEPSASE